MALSALLLCSVLFVMRLIRILRMGAPKEYSKASGSVAKGVVYSYTEAMMPYHKESAYLHWPTFIAGLLFHIGAFVAILTFTWSILTAIFGWPTSQVIVYICCGILLVTACCGVGLFAKRMIRRALRALSCADDYLSNGITTIFQFITVGYLLCSHPIPYYVVATLFFLWLPIGKTRHLLYFFAARFHLGFFYGRRGTWPITHD